MDGFGFGSNLVLLPTSSFLSALAILELSVETLIRCCGARTELLLFEVLFLSPKKGIDDNSSADFCECKKRGIARTELV